MRPATTVSPAKSRTMPDRGQGNRHRTAFGSLQRGVIAKTNGTAFARRAVYNNASRSSPTRIRRRCSRGCSRAAPCRRRARAARRRPIPPPRGGPARPGQEPPGSAEARDRGDQHDRRHRRAGEAGPAPHVIARARERASACPGRAAGTLLAEPSPRQGRVRHEASRRRHSGGRVVRLPDLSR